MSPAAKAAIPAAEDTKIAVTAAVSLFQAPYAAAEGQTCLINWPFFALARNQPVHAPPGERILDGRADKFPARRSSTNSHR
jgi:hypothetical protein